MKTSSSQRLKLEARFFFLKIKWQRQEHDLGHLVLREVSVHLVTVEVSVVGLADGVVESHHAFAFQHPGP